MGSGIVAALLTAGLFVTVVEQDPGRATNAASAIDRILKAAETRGAATAAETSARQQRVRAQVGYDGMEAFDLVVEAVFEDLEVKRDVFAELGRRCHPDAVLATNTSYIDPRLIAEIVPDPRRFLGLHFFSPAHVMTLLEIVPTPDTAPDVLATGFELARRLGKIPVRSGICDGFIGNRILRRYRTECEAMVRDGVPVQDIDAAMRGFGYAMGPFEMQDMAGLDISFMHREAARARGEALPETLGDTLVRAGRKGQKSGGGWYDYAAGDKRPRISKAVEDLLSPYVSPRSHLTDDEMVARILSAMASEGEAVLVEGIAAKPEDIDLVQVHGYGFPRRHGGPMFYRARTPASEASTECSRFASPHPHYLVSA